MKVTYTATTADGREFTRKSTRTYTHACIVTMPNGATWANFAGSADLAHKAANSYFSVPNAYRHNHRAYAMETARMDALRATATIEVVEVTA